MCTKLHGICRSYSWNPLDIRGQSIRCTRTAVEATLQIHDEHGCKYQQHHNFSTFCWIEQRCPPCMNLPLEKQGKHIRIGCKLDSSVKFCLYVQPEEPVVIRYKYVLYYQKDRRKKLQGLCHTFSNKRCKIATSPVRDLVITIWENLKSRSLQRQNIVNVSGHLQNASTKILLVISLPF